MEPASLVSLCLFAAYSRYGDEFEKKLSKFIPLEDLASALTFVKKKNEMIEKIKAVAYENDGKFFGGYVRDLHSRQTFNDIDIIFFNIEHHKIFIESIFEELNTILLKTGPKYMSLGFGCTSLWVSLKEDPTIHLKLDVVFAENADDGIQKFTHDFDVNALVLTRTNNRFVGINPIGSTLGKTFRHLDQKRFFILDNLGQYTKDHLNGDQCINRCSPKGRKILRRIEKMKKKGWAPINPQCCPYNAGCILATKEILEEHRKSCERARERERNEIKKKIQKRNERLYIKHLMIRPNFIPVLTAFSYPKELDADKFNRKYLSKQKQIRKKLRIQRSKL